MGLLNRLEREVVKRLKPWLAPGHDARLKVTPSASQLLLQLCDISFDVAALNEAAMSTTSLLLHEVVVEEVDLKLSLLSFPVVTVVLRGVHVVVKPRTGNEPHASSNQTAEDPKTEAVLEDSTKPQGEAKEQKEASLTSFIIDSLTNFALSSLRLELHDCSVKFISYSLKPLSYVCSASLESFILEEGSAGGDKTADGIFQASIEAVRSRWEQKVGSVKKMCIFRGLALNLETVSNRSKDTIFNSRENFGNLGRRRKSSSFINRRQNKPSVGKGYVGEKRDQLLLFEVVSVAVSLRGTEFLGLVVEIPEVFVGLDAREIDVLMVLAAQANGAGVRETDQTLDMAMLKVRKSRLESKRTGLSISEFSSDVNTELNSEGEIVEPGDEDRGGKESHQEDSGADGEAEVVRIPAHRVFHLLAWRLWVHNLSEVVGFAIQIIFVILLVLRSLPALLREAWQLTVGMKHSESELAEEKPNSSEEQGENPTTASSDDNSDSSLFKVVQSSGPTFEVYFSRALFTLVGAADDDTDETAGDTSKLNTGGVLPGVHMTLERISLEYGLDNIGSGGRFGVGHWQVDLISVVSSQSLHEHTHTLREGRWKKNASDTLQLIKSKPYKARMKTNDKFKDLQDTGDVPQAAIARKRHYDWQDNVANAWSQHEWKLPADLKGDESDVASSTFKGDVSRAFLIAEFGTADVGSDGLKVLGGLMTCGLSMGCLDFYSDSTTSYRITPLIDQLSATSVPGQNAEPDKALADPNDSEVDYEEQLLDYLNLCRHYIGLAVPTSRVELSVVIESSKFTFAATMGQFENDQLTENDGPMHSSRGSSLVVEIGSLQLLTWPASSKEALSELEARVPVKDAAPLGWWDDCVDEKLWLMRPPTPSFPADILGSEEEQIGNNLYFALEDAGVKLRTDRNRKSVVPVLGPISCVMQSSFCRDDLYSQKGVIKSASVSLDGKLAPLAVHLYLEEMAIFQEIIDFGNALMEGFGSSTDSNEDQLNMRGTEPLKNASTGQQTTDANATADAPAKILFVFFLSLQLEAFQIVLGDRRIGESIEGHTNTVNRRVNPSQDRHSRNQGDRHAVQKARFPGHGRYCYFATLPFSFDMSVGDGYETRISLELNGAHMGVIQKQHQKVEQEQSLSQSLLDGTVLDVIKLFQIAVTGFALERSKITICGPKLIGQVERQSSMHRGRADVETQVNASLSPADGATASSGKDSAFHEQTPEQGPSVDGPLHHDEEPGIKLPGHNRSDDPHWLVVNVDIGSISVTDDLREALIDKIMLLVSGSSTLHIELKIGKDSRNVTMDVEGGLAIIQTAALHSLVEYVNDHLNLLSEPATSSSRSVTREFSEKFSEQSSNNTDSTSSSLRNSGRSASLPPWAGTKNLSKMRRMASAPRRLQAATELTPELAPKKGYDGNLSASLVGFSLVLVQRGSTVVAPVEGFIMEVDTKGQCNVKHGSVIQVSAAVTRASILGLQGRTFGRMNTRSGRKPQFRNNFVGGSNDEPGQGSHKSHHGHHTLSPSPSGMSEDYNDHHEWNEQPFEDEGAWKPLDESHSYILERLSLTASMEKVPADKHPDFWKWRNSWKGHFSMVGVDFAITTSEVQLLLSVTEPLSGLSGSSSPPNVPEPEYEHVKDQIDEPEAEEPGTDSYLPDGAVIAIQDMNEHYYLAVEEKGANTGTFRLMGVLHFSLVGDRALFKVRYQRNKNGGKTKWFSLLSLLASDSNGEPYRVHFLPGSGLAEVTTTTHDNSGELWECIESTEEKSEGSEELGFQTSRRAFHLVNQKSKSGLSLSEGFPMLVQRPGNSFKLRILAREKEEPGTVKLVSLEHGDKDEVDHGHDHDTSQELTDSAIAATVIPNVTCEIHDFTFTLLHEASGGVHLLPLIRMCMQDIGAVLQMGSGKTRVLFGCSLSLDFFQAQNSCWVAMINPVGVELLYRARNENLTPGAVRKKTPVTLFCRLRKVDIIISELSLDTLLFLIGALDLAGPYTLRQSPVLANRCQVENRTGLDLVCRFDHGNAKREEVTESLETSAFLIRHTTSRRDLSSAEVATSVEVYLQKHGGGHSSSVQVSLVEPGLIATRTRLKLSEGRKNGGPGPILVVDVLRQSQGGVSLTVSPMVRVRNATGQFLELQCRRPNQDGDGALVLLEDGDIIDDCMGSFDALMLEGELRKALSSFNVGNFLLSIRPASGSASESGEFGKQEEAPSAYDWSDDVKGAKAVRISNLFEKFQYDFKKRIGGRNSDVAFGTVFCPAKRSENKDDGLYFLIRTTKRQVPVVRLDKELEGGKPSVASWQEQQEFLLLPTIRIFNLFTSSISAKLLALAPGRADGKAGSQLLPKTEITVKAGKVELMYADLGVLSLVIKHVKSGLTSKQIPVFGRDKRSPDASKEGGGLRETELDVDFGDGAHYGKMKVHQDDDGVLEVVLYTKYALFNDSHVPLLYCAPRQKNSYLWRRGKKNDSNLEWPAEETVSSLRPGSRISWFNKSSKVMMKQALPDAQPALLDLDNLAGSTEISLKVSSKENADQRVQLGVELQLPAIGDTNPTRTVHLAPRYIVVNKSNDVMCICQDGFQNDESAVMELSPGEKTALNCRVAPEEGDEKNKSDDGQNPMQEPLSVRFKPRGQEWNWSGPVCAAALGSFWIKIRRQGQMGFANSHKQVKGRMLFALAEVQEDSPSLLMCFRRHSADAIPYRIENGLHSDALLYSQKGLTQTEVLEAAASVDYVWDDLGLTHKLVVTIRGTQLCQVINMDKIREWKRFGAARRGKGFSFQLPFADESKESDNEGDENSTGTMFRHVGYEVIADGPTRVLRICLHSDSNKQSGWQSTMRRPKTEVEVKIPLFFFSLVEPVKQKNDASEVEKDAGEQTTEKRVLYAPIVSARITHLLIEGLVTDECTLGQLKVERLDMDVKWQGSTVIHMMRVRGQNGDDKPGQTVLHIAGVMAHRGTNPIQLHYASLLLQAVDLNIDEDTLMKLAPFYRVSLAPSIGPSRLIYYERFEIHPIKILASYTPGNPQADYTSAQETLRAFLHTVVKVPAVRGFKVELNGVLLSNALLTYAQLAVKCAQHYSWYAMRAVYIARGSSLLPPGFASLFDDSAASSLDVFFDPSNGSVDVQGLTLGMFNILSKGLRKKGQGGSSRLLGDVEQTVKLAGSNILFAVVTEVSDSVLKGAEASGLDGLLSGFRRGILNVAMRPAVLRSAVAQGGSTRRIKLDHSVGMDEVYIEGYLQAMLDAQFRQDYLKVKVTDEEVLLRNLPPNTSLMEEIMSAVKKFLIAEGLLTGESSLATARPTRRQLGNTERRIGPAMIALCEQLLVVIAVQGLRKQAKKYVHFPRGAEEKPVAPEKAVVPVEEPAQPQEGMLPRVRHAATNFVLSSGLAYLDGRLCRHIPNTLVRRIVSGFLLSFME